MGALRIVAGGQTGADRAALDWALRRGVPCGGWCPRGRRAEDGVIDARYPLRETPREDYAQRTEWNARDSDGTAIFTLGTSMSGGTLLTAEMARRCGKPWVHLCRAAGEDAALQLRDFIRDHGIRTLNVAGPRASEEPGIEAFVTSTLDRALGSWKDRDEGEEGK